MENSKKIIDWSLRNSARLDVRAEYYTRLREIIPGMFDIGISIKFNSKEYFGRGSDFKEEIAYCKALSEAIERASLQENKINNTNGLAIHPDFNTCKIIARNELLERDAFLSGYLLKSGLESLPMIDLIDMDYFKSKKVEINLYRMCNYSFGDGVLCVASGVNHVNQFGLVMGSAFDGDIKKATLKAIVECIRILNHVEKQDRVENLSLEFFNCLDNYSFSSHGKLALNLEYAKSFLKQLNNPVLEIVEPNEESINYNIIGSTMFPCEEFPLYVVKADSKKLQQLFVGKTDQDTVNLDRLSGIAKKKLSIADLNLVPHPFD